MPEQSRNVVEGRAVSARPSARLLSALVAALAVAGVIAPAAQAVKPATPILEHTNPESPSTFLEPYVQGSADGIITSVVHPRTAAFRPIAATMNPAFIIKIYTDEDCEGPVTAEGTALQLEGAGIQVTAAEGVQTTFYANQYDPSDLGNPSDCSTGLDYRHVTEPPPVPNFETVSPPSGSNDNFPRLLGDSDPDATVSVYTTSDCSGEPVASGTGEEFADTGLQLTTPVPDNSVTTFYAEAELAGLSSGCSEVGITYEEVTPPQEEPPVEEPPVEEPTPPHPGIPDVPGNPQPPKLRTIPAGRANDNTPRVTGSAPGAVTVKVYGSAGCKGPVLVQGSAAEFAAGLTIQVVDNATVTLYGATIDAGGDKSHCSNEPAVYTEDSTAPRTRITSGPGVKTHHRRVVFRFADVTGDPSAQFRCRIDRRRWRACQTPLKLRRLGRRRHVVRIKAVDAAGNREHHVAKRRFKVIGRHRAHRRHH
jgi:hypothetical protein